MFKWIRFVNRYGKYKHHIIYTSLDLPICRFNWDELWTIDKLIRMRDKPLVLFQITASRYIEKRIKENV